MNTIILIQLLLAHILTDFVLQTKSMVESKNVRGLKSPYFWIHILLSGVLTYILLMKWTIWVVPLFIMTTHFAIDFWKIKQGVRIRSFNDQQENFRDKKTDTVHFFLDQLFHLIAVVIAWLYITQSFGEVLPFAKSLLTEKRIIAIITATILVVWPVGIAIGKITEPFRKELSEAHKDDSLSKAGSYIGVVERLLVLIFVLIGQYAAIGFLIAAKSVLRISKDGEKEARKKTEYVLIGTLLSFTIAIVIGLMAKHLISE